MSVKKNTLAVIVGMTLLVLATALISPLVLSRSDNPCIKPGCHGSGYHEYLEITSSDIPAVIEGNATVTATIKISTPDDWRARESYYKCTNVSVELSSARGYVSIHDPLQFAQHTMYPDDEWHVFWNVSADVPGEDELTITAKAFNPHGPSNMEYSYSGVIEVLVAAAQGDWEPIATIVSITPVIAKQGDAITFEGSAVDADGYVTEYRWHSSIDGYLSDQLAFTTSALSPGKHTIYFRAKDDNGTWSDDAEARIYVQGAARTEPGRLNVMTLWRWGRITGFIALFLLLSIIISCLWAGKAKRGCPRSMFRIHYFMFFAIFVIGIYHCVVLYVGPYAGSTKGLFSGTLSSVLLMVTCLTCICRKVIVAHIGAGNWRKFHLGLVTLTFIISLVHAILVGTTLAFLRWWEHP